MPLSGLLSKCHGGAPLPTSGTPCRDGEQPGWAWEEVGAGETFSQPWQSWDHVTAVLAFGFPPARSTRRTETVERAPGWWAPGGRGRQRFTVCPEGPWAVPWARGGRVPGLAAPPLTDAQRGRGRCRWDRHPRQAPPRLTCPSAAVHSRGARRAHLVPRPQSAGLPGAGWGRSLRAAEAGRGHDSETAA